MSRLFHHHHSKIGNLENFTGQTTPQDRNVLESLYDTMAAMVEGEENEEIPD